MITDTNSIINAAFQTIVGASGGGDWIFLGLIMLILFGIVLIIGKAKAGMVIVTGVSLIFIFSMFYTGFIMLFWVAVIASVLLLILGMKNKTSGQ